MQDVADVGLGHRTATASLVLELLPGRSTRGQDHGAQAVPFGRAVTLMEMNSEVLCLTASELAVGPLWLVDAF
jgi:hypothetical protein